MITIGEMRSGSGVDPAFLVGEYSGTYTERVTYDDGTFGDTEIPGERIEIRAGGPADVEFVDGVCALPASLDGSSRFSFSDETCMDPGGDWTKTCSGVGNKVGEQLTVEWSCDFQGHATGNRYTIDATFEGGRLP